MTFDQWMAEVDVVMVGMSGLDHNCIADQTWWDWWNDEVPAQEAAEEALANEGFPI